MEKQKNKNIPNILCPFLERECPLGEKTARLCWRRINFDDQSLIDFEDYSIDCSIADWMFSKGARLFN